MLDIYKLQNQYLSLQSRTRAMRETRPSIPTSEAEGYELGPIVSSSSAPSSDSTSVGKGEIKFEPSKEGEMKEKVVALKKEWRGWQLASLKNL